MIGALSAVGFGAFLLSCCVVGVRLLLLASRSGRLAEWVIAVAILGLGPLGYGQLFGARLLDDTHLQLAVWLTVAAVLSISFGAGLLDFFCWRVFRRGSNGGRVVVFVMIVLLCLSTAGDAFHRMYHDLSGAGPWFWLAFALRIQALAWAAFESLRYWRMMRRRMQIGLADPVVTNRFLLWGVGASSACVGFTAGLAVRAITGMSVTQFPATNLWVSVLSTISAVAIWLAFFPPPAYLRRVRASG
ncbi:MAG: hypothetical protein MJE66_15815 [Proteobacteria bacterium]|nr:hypothetical protein [Pseudomonadota bacterium]